MSDQAANLRKRIDQTNNPHVSKTISIVSGKGGVGKSNIAINFSLELIALNKKVLLFDLDVGMGNIDILLGLHAKQTVVDMLMNQLSIFSIIEKGPNNLSYIAGGSSLSHFFTMDDYKTDYFLAEYEQLVEHYDYIIFDLGAGVSEDSMFFNLASDEIIVVTTPEPTSITDAYSVIKHIVNKDNRMPIYVVMNRCSSKEIGEQTFDRFQQVVSRFLHADIMNLGNLPDDQTVTEAVMQQKPYVLIKKHSMISKAIKNLTYNYVYQQNKSSDVQSDSFIQRFKRLIMRR